MFDNLFYMCIIRDEQRRFCKSRDAFFFVRRDAQMKLLLVQRAPRAASRGKSFSYSIGTSPMQRKYGAEGRMGSVASRG